MSQKKVIIIGAGVAGMAASIRLAHAGFSVDVFEANDFPGGKINSKTIKGYRFDQGPSVFTAPHYIKELYELCGVDFSEFPFVELDRSFHYFFNDGTRVQLGVDREEMIKELSSKLDEDETALRKYLDKAQSNYEHISPLFIEKSLHRWRSLVGKRFFKAIARLPKYRLSSTMHEENQKVFRNPKTVQVFNRFATYNGSSAYKAPAMLNMISHLEINEAPLLPKNGMIQITDALYELALKKGVNFHFSEKVEEILLKHKTVEGVKTSSGTYKADAVVSNMDVTFTYERLMPSTPRPEKILRQEKSSSAVVFYWGIHRTFPELTLHNVFFTGDYEAEFNGIFEKKRLVDDPTIYINITSKFIPEDAPEGCENWFVMINSPIDSGQNWEEEISRLRKNVIAKLSRELDCDLESLIETEEILTPQLIENRYSGKSGSIYGNASNNRFAAFYRHPNFSQTVKKLYFAGVSVHPGGGIPLALNSARLACEAIQRDMRK